MILLVSSDIKLAKLFANLLAHICGSISQNVVISRGTNQEEEVKLQLSHSPPRCSSTASAFSRLVGQPGFSESHSSQRPGST